MKDRKTAVVTGALGVIGKAIVEALLEDGLRIVLVDLDQDRLDAYCGNFPPDKLLPVACDISSPTEVDTAVAWIREKWDDVEVLVNNAGILSPASLQGIMDDVFTL